MQFSATFLSQSSGGSCIAPKLSLNGRKGSFKSVVRFGSEADINDGIRHVRFTLKSGHSSVH